MLFVRPLPALDFSSERGDSPTQLQEGCVINQQIAGVLSYSDPSLVDEWRSGVRDVRFLFLWSSLWV
jgi:hypothetical protein